MRAIAIGLHRTILDNGWWVNSVRTPLGQHDTVVYDRPGVWAPLASWRSDPNDEGWRTAHLKAVEWARDQKRRATKEKGQAFGPRKTAA